jgi:hypothetical protein
MPSGSIIHGSKSNPIFITTCAIVRKIYKHFGYNAFTFGDANKLLTKKEQDAFNINRLKNKNMVEHLGRTIERRPQKLWRLKLQTVALCKMGEKP